MALNLRAMTIFNGPDPPLPSLVDDGLEDLVAQLPSSDTFSEGAPTPSLRVLDAGTEASIRRKRAEREMWLDEAYTNFVQGMIDAGASLSSLYMNHKRISLVDCKSASLNTSGTSLDSPMTRLADPPPPSPASSHAMSPRPQIEVSKLMKSLRELKLVERLPPSECEWKNKKRVCETELPGLRARTASGSKSVIRMFHGLFSYSLHLPLLTMSFVA